MKKIAMYALTAVCLLSFQVGILLDTAFAGDYQGLKEVKSVSTIYDFRDGKPESALVHLKLIHDTYKDKALRAITPNPDFVVVFMGPSVMLLSKNRDKFSTDEQKQLKEFDAILAAMAKDGIRLEACKFAMNVFGVDTGSIAPEITQVDNGWIASLGYQHKDYSLVPVF